MTRAPSTHPLLHLPVAAAALALVAPACGDAGAPGTDEVGVVSVSLVAPEDLARDAELGGLSVQIGDPAAGGWKVEVRTGGAPLFLRLNPDEARVQVKLALHDRGGEVLATHALGLEVEPGDLVELTAAAAGADGDVHGLEVEAPRAFRPGRDYAAGRLYIHTGELEYGRLYEITRELGARVVERADGDAGTVLLELEGGASVAGAIEHALTFPEIQRAWPAWHDAAAVGVAFTATPVVHAARDGYEASPRHTFLRAAGGGTTAAMPDALLARPSLASRFVAAPVAEAVELLSARWSARSARYTERVELMARLDGAASGAVARFDIFDAERGERVDTVLAKVDAEGVAVADWSYDFLGKAQPGARFFFEVEAAGARQSSETLALTEPFYLTFRTGPGDAIRGMEYRLDFTDGSTVTATTDLMGTIYKDDYVPSEVEVFHAATGFHLRRFDPIGHLRPDDAGYVAERMVAAAQHPDLWERIHAINDLGNMRTQEALPLLERLLEEPEHAIWYNAAQALGNLKLDLSPIARRFIEQVETGPDRVKAVDVLGALGGEEAVELLAGLARSGQGDLRLHAVYALGRADFADEGQRERVVEALLENLDGAAYLADPHLRAEAALALGRAGDRRAVDALTRTLRDAYPIVRMRAAEALRGLVQPGDSDAAEQLRRRLADRDHRVALHAGAALATIEGARVALDLQQAAARPNLPEWAAEELRREYWLR